MGSIKHNWLLKFKHDVLKKKNVFVNLSVYLNTKRIGFVKHQKRLYFNLINHFGLIDDGPPVCNGDNGNVNPTDVNNWARD